MDFCFHLSLFLLLFCITVFVFVLWPLSQPTYSSWYIVCIVDHLFQNLICMKGLATSFIARILTELCDFRMQG